MVVLKIDITECVVIGGRRRHRIYLDITKCAVIGGDFTAQCTSKKPGLAVASRGYDVLP